MTLLEALSARRKDTGLSGEETALIRHGVAALLNAAHSGVSFHVDEAFVVNRVQRGLGNSDAGAWKDYLEQLNEYGCPLD